jgi:hypothetical protein
MNYYSPTWYQTRFSLYLSYAAAAAVMAGRRPPAPLSSFPPFLSSSLDAAALLALPPRPFSPQVWALRAPWVPLPPSQVWLARSQRGRGLVQPHLLPLLPPALPSQAFPRPPVQKPSARAP